MTAAPALLEELRSAPLQVLGRFAEASNLTLLAETADGLRCVYKPVAGERPLWDFPTGTLAGREVAMYELARALGWDLVPEAGLRADGARVFPHALRHSCGTHLIQSGVDIRYVQAHLGHASPVTTEIYTHVTAAHLRDDFDRAHPRSRR